MSNKRLEKRFIIAVIIGIIANILTLLLWIVFRINPIIPQIQEVKSEILNQELNNNYTSYDDMLEAINKTSQKHNLIRYFW